MYVITHEVTDGNEPHLGAKAESSLIENPGEGLGYLIEYMAENQECPEDFTVEDEITDDKILLKSSSYLSHTQIDALNEMFIADDNWSEEQLKHLLEVTIQ